MKRKHSNSSSHHNNKSSNFTDRSINQQHPTVSTSSQQPFGQLFGTHGSGGSINQRKRNSVDNTQLFQNHIKLKDGSIGPLTASIPGSSHMVYSQKNSPRHVGGHQPVYVSAAGLLSGINNRGNTHSPVKQGKKQPHQQKSLRTNNSSNLLNNQSKS